MNEWVKLERDREAKEEEEQTQCKATTQRRMNIPALLTLTHTRFDAYLPAFLCHQKGLEDFEFISSWDGSASPAFRSEPGDADQEMRGGGRGYNGTLNASHPNPGIPRRRSMLSLALETLVQRCAFVGLMERFEDSMLLLKLTFPHDLGAFRAYQTSPHPSSSTSSSGSRRRILQSSQSLRGQEDPQQALVLGALRVLNRMDEQLYGAAVDLFDRRFHQATSGEQSGGAGKAERRRFQFVGKVDVPHRNRRKHMVAKRFELM